MAAQVVYFASVIKALLKNALFGVIVCTAVGGGVGSVFHANILQGGESVDGSGEGGSGETPKCILSISACPLTEPNCGIAPIRLTVSCLDPSCTQGSCVPAGQSQSGQSGGGGTSDSCLLRHFECAKDARASCYKRWHSTALTCSSGACTSDVSCMKSDTFFSTYSLQPWDIGQLSGPFPRTEVMCVIQQSSCAPNDPSCLSPVTIEQVPCDDSRCASGSCTRKTVLVDQTDSIIVSTGQTTTNPTGGDTTTVTVDGGNKVSDSQSDRSGDSGNQNDSGNSGSGKSGDSVQVSVPVLPLGCFDATGGWTTDRTKCATNQQQFVDPNAKKQSVESTDPVVRKQIEQTIETKFIPDTRKNTLVQNLLSSTVEATGRLDTLLSHSTLPDDLRQQAQTTLDALKSVQNNVSAPDVSVRDIQDLADTVSLQLADIQKNTTTWKQKSDVPTGVMDKLDNIFKTLPAVFQLLQQSNVPLDAAVTNQYGVAAQVYVPVHGSCLADADTCGDLSKVFDALEPIVTGIKTTLDNANRPDLEQQIDQMLQ